MYDPARFDTRVPGYAQNGPHLQRTTSVFCSILTILLGAGRGATRFHLTDGRRTPHAHALSPCIDGDMRGDGSPSAGLFVLPTNCGAQHVGRV